MTLPIDFNVMVMVALINLVVLTRVLTRVLTHLVVLDLVIVQKTKLPFLYQQLLEGALVLCGGYFTQKSKQMVVDVENEMKINLDFSNKFHHIQKNLFLVILQIHKNCTCQLQQDTIIYFMNNVYSGNVCMSQLFCQFWISSIKICNFIQIIDAF